MKMGAFIIAGTSNISAGYHQNSDFFTHTFFFATTFRAPGFSLRQSGPIRTDVGKRSILTQSAVLGEKIYL